MGRHEVFIETALRKGPAPKKGGQCLWNALYQPPHSNLLNFLLQLKLSNVHIRYEDDSMASRSEEEGNRVGVVSVGVMLDEVSAHTVDEGGRRAFVTRDVLQCLRKVWGWCGDGVGI